MRGSEGGAVERIRGAWSNPRSMYMQGKGTGGGRSARTCDSAPPHTRRLGSIVWCQVQMAAHVRRVHRTARERTPYAMTTYRFRGSGQLPKRLGESRRGETVVFAIVGELRHCLRRVCTSARTLKHKMVSDNGFLRLGYLGDHTRPSYAITHISMRSLPFPMFATHHVRPRLLSFGSRRT